MWIWILLAASPFLLLMLIEESIVFFVRRYVYGPSHKGSKLIKLFKKLRQRTSVENTTSL